MVDFSVGGVGKAWRDWDGDDELDGGSVGFGDCWRRERMASRGSGAVCLFRG